MARWIAFTIIVASFWYFFYRSEQLSALSLFLGVLWLIFRETQQILRNRERRPPRISRPNPEDLD